MSDFSLARSSVRVFQGRLFSAPSDDRFQRIPLCRALVCDFPEDPAVGRLEDPFLLRHNLAVASLPLDQIQRQVNNSKAKASAKSLEIANGLLSSSGRERHFP
jgi:hypothetical protein